MDVKVGQIWEYAGVRYKKSPRIVSNRDEIKNLPGPILAIEILAVNQINNTGTFTGKAYHPCKVVKNDSDYLDLCVFDDDGYLVMVSGIFERAIEEGQWTLLLDSNVAGAICIKCGQISPYATYSPNFKCWSCKHGY